MRFTIKGKGSKVYTVTVDQEDANLLRLYIWRPNVQTCGSVYFRRYSGEATLHRVIARAKAGDIVTFVNGDTLDLRKANLRVEEAMKARCRQLATARIHQQIYTLVTG